MKRLINANVLKYSITKRWTEGAINTADMKEVVRLIDGMGHEDDWTPVTEALPDHDGEYLVTTINDCGTRRRQVSSFVLFNGGACYSWGIETSPMYKVLAWCELPPEWEEDSK